MATAFAGRLNKIRQGAAEWYQEHRFRQVRFWGFFGIAVGWTTAKLKRALRYRKCEFGDHIVVTEYELDKKNVAQFEKHWNDHAKLTQRCDGYVGTKLFKALERDWPGMEAVEGGESVKSEEKVGVDMETHTISIRGHLVIGLKGKP